MASATTTVRVSRATLSELDRFQKALQTKTVDETIQSLLGVRRKELIARLYGSAGVSKPFGESDRIDADH